MVLVLSQSDLSLCDIICLVLLYYFSLSLYHPTVIPTVSSSLSSPTSYLPFSLSLTLTLHVIVHSFFLPSSLAPFVSFWVPCSPIPEYVQWFTCHFVCFLFSFRCLVRPAFDNPSLSLLRSFSRLLQVVLEWEKRPHDTETHSEDSEVQGTDTARARAWQNSCTHSEMRSHTLREGACAGTGREGLHVHDTHRKMGAWQRHAWCQDKF